MNMTERRVVVMADGDVGAACARWLLEHYRDDLGLVVTTAENDISAASHAAGVLTAPFRTSAQIAALARDNGLDPLFGLLLWWPRIIKAPLIKLPELGFINTHPSLLPYNRGKHYNFWALVEQAPFGVTLHSVDEGIDTGPIIAQLPLSVGWDDTGASLYRRAQAAMIELVQSTYPRLRTGRFETVAQNPAEGSFHSASELEAASRIALDAPTTARDVLNRLRARTFPGYPGCRFEDDGRTYEVTVSIKEIT